MVEGVRGNLGPLLGISNARLSRRVAPLRLRTTALVVAAAFGAASPGAHANPEGAKVVNGQATITNTGSTLVIKNSPGAIINWQSFSIGKGETTTFIQQSVNSAILNRVIGANPSIILGDLSSNGKVFLVNANGVIFGKGATVDAAGLVVSSLDITDSDFKAGTLRFVGSAASGDISVAGVIRSTDGDVYLIAPNITNTGSIEAVGGNAILAAGQSVEIIGTDAADIKFDVQNTGNTALNLGQISGDAVGIFAGTLTQAGGVNANALSVSGGKVILTAQGSASLAAGSTTSADNAAGSAGSVTVQAQTGNLTVAQGASVSASGARGGFVTLLADQGSNTISGSIAATGSMQLGGSIDVLGAGVAVTSGATVDASGAGGGGALVVGGAPSATGLLLAKNTTVASGAALIADATSQGNGGSIDVYGVDTVAVQGSIFARGGVSGGNGGTVDTSGAVVAVSGPLSAAARNANGHPGMWTLDPNSIDIDNGTAYSTTPILNTTTGISEVNASYLGNVLSGGTSVTLSTATAPGGSGPTGPNTGYVIDVSAPISINPTSYGVALTLNAGGQIAFQTGGSVTATGTPFTLNLNSDLAGGTGGVSIAAPISMTGGTINITSAGFTNTSTITASTFHALATTGVAIFNNSGGTIDASADDNGLPNAAGGSIGVTGYTVTALGTMTADGSSPIYGNGGAGGTISILNAASIGDTGGTLSATGGTSEAFYGAPGKGGTIELTTTAGGTLALTGTSISVNGGIATTAYPGGGGGTIELISAGDLTLANANLSALGGMGGAGYYSTGADGGTGGSIILSAPAGLIQITDSALVVDGGPGSDTSIAGQTLPGGIGGSGGSINVSGAAVDLGAGTTLSAQGGTNAAGGAAGGAGGVINLSASGSVQLNSATLDVVGGVGANAITETAGPIDAGAGGAGGTISVSGQTTVSFTGGSLYADGGAGGTGGVATNGQTGSNGGPGGAAGSLNITGGFGASLSDVYMSANGGQAGDGGAFNGTPSTSTFSYAGDGGAGGAAGLITIAQLYGSANLDIQNTSVLSASGGAGGAGGALSGNDALANGGNGGAGGAGGQIVITSSGSGAVLVSASSVNVGGGWAGAGGTAENDVGVGGGGGAGGSGGSINVSGASIGLSNSSTLSAEGGSNAAGGAVGGAGGVIILSAPGSIQLNAATLDVVGGVGANAISEPAGPIAAGAGGAGGTISVSGQNTVSFIGGDLYADGGLGGTGAVTTDGQTSSNGGAGGAAGSLSITGWYGASLSGVYMSANGGQGGDGGAFNGSASVSTAGSGGAGGAGGLITIGQLNGTANFDIQNGSFLSASGGTGGAGGALSPTGTDAAASGGNGGAGGAGGQIVLTSSGAGAVAVAVSGSTVTVGGGYGGAGGAAESDLGGGGNGAAGGSAGSINVSGASIDLSNSSILAAEGGTNAAGSVAGGAGGVINLSASGSVQLNAATLDVVGGVGANAIIEPAGSINAGAGGAGGTISVSGQDTVSFIGGSLYADGGAGGTGAVTTDGQTGSNGGAGGAAGSLSITGWYGATLSGVYMSANGGQAGDGGAFNGSASASTAGSGGAGGAAGLITIAQLYGSADLDIANASILSAVGGAGGAGGALSPTGTDALASGGNGGAGGAGGQIVITSSGTGAVALSGSTVTVGGGNGGAGGAAESDLGGGGSGGAGGVGATIFGDNDAYAIVINSSGTITIDSGSVLNATGGAGGLGQDSAGLVRATASVGPGNGGDGGDAYGIELLGYSAVSVAGTLTIQGGAGGNGGNLLGGAISPQGETVISAGNGGNGGNVYNPLNIAANLDNTGGEVYGTVTTVGGGTITILGGAGGSGGYSNDNPTNFSGNTVTYGPGNGGTGGSVDMANISAYGDIALSGNITIAGGAGGAGGGITSSSDQDVGTGGAGGNFSGLTVSVNTSEEYGENLYLYGTIETDVGFGGAYGTVGGYNYYGYASDGSSGYLNLYTTIGSIYQFGGALTSNTSAMNVNVSAGYGQVDLDQGGNVISTITGSADYEMYIQSTGNSSVNMTAVNLSAGNGIDLTAYEMTLSGSIQSNYGQINISADNLTAGSLTNLAIAYPDVTAANTTGGNNNIDNWISIQPISSYQPIIITADSYNTPGVESNGTNALIIGKEIFSSLSAPELVIGQSGGSSTINFSSLNSTSGTVTMPQGAQLTLYATTVSQDQYTQLATDYLYINANNVSLTGLTAATPGQAVYLEAVVADSGYNDTLNISAAPAQKLIIGNLTGTNLNLTTSFSGLQGYEYVTLGADQLSIQSPITMYSGYSVVDLGPVTYGTPTAINPTSGFTGFGLTNDDLANITADGGYITIGNGGGTMTVNGPVSLPNVTNGALTLVADNGGDINFSGSSLDVGSNNLYVNAYGGGNINDNSMVLTAGYVSLYSTNGSIGTAGAPIYLNITGGEFEAEASNNVYVQGLSDLTSEYVYGNGTISIATPGLGYVNQGGIQGGTVTITGAYIQNYGNISGSTISLTATNSLYNDSYANISGSSVALTAGGQLNLYGTVYSQGDLSLSGGAIVVASAGVSATVLQGQNITINGGSLLVTGDIDPPETLGLRGHYLGDPADTSVLIDANGTLNVTISGDMTVSGGNYGGAFAEMISGSNSTYNIGGALLVAGGTQSGAFALLDPSNGATMNISAQNINLTGGTSDSTYAAIVSAGDVILTAPQYIALHDGSGANSDAVVIANSGLGTITANTPSCINCEPQTGSYPLTNTTTEQGFYGGAAAAAPPPAAPPPAAPPPAAPPPAAPPPAPAPQAYGNNELDALIEDLLTLLDTPLNDVNVRPVEAVIFVEGGADGCF